MHFFRNAIALLREEGHEVVTTSRDKDLTHRLLDLYGIPHEPISREARTKAGLAVELAVRNARLLRLVRGVRPHVMASIGGISTAQVGFLTRTPNAIFYDTETARLSNLLSYPFATEVVTPACYTGRVFGRHVTYPGYHELAYLHPSRFKPDASVLAAHGIHASDPFTVVRFVSWRAVHDASARGFSGQAKRRLVAALAARGRVFVTSEAPLPEELEAHRLLLPPHHVHHLLAFAQLCVGESATMASEAVLLGTPAIYLDAVGRGYTDEQQARYGVCWNFRPHQAEQAIGRAEEILVEGLKGTQGFRSKVDRLLSETIDVTAFVRDKLLELAGR